MNEKKTWIMGREGLAWGQPSRDHLPKYSRSDWALLVVAAVIIELAGAVTARNFSSLRTYRTCFVQALILCLF